MYVHLMHKRLRNPVETSYREFKNKIGGQISYKFELARFMEYLEMLNAR